MEAELRILYFDCFSGASGDMLLGCLLDAGLSLQDLEADVACLGVGGYSLSSERVTRRGLTGTQFSVHLENAERPARNLSAIESIIRASGLPVTVQEPSLAVFRRIASAEAAVHGTTIDKVHFHEIGAVDSLVDVVGFCAALQRLEIDQVYCSALTLGGGTIQTEHGRLPAPAPATLSLLAEAGAPTVPGPAQTELVTPTGAALLAEFAAFQRPPMTIQAVGYGFGTKEFDWPNALRVWVGSSEPAGWDVQGGADEVVLLECNLDDATGELLGYAMERLLAEAALDVWFTPIQMKKDRPGVQLSVLCSIDRARALAALILRETPTLGVRWRQVSRLKAGREMRQVQTPWGPVAVKAKLLDGETVALSPEYDDCARLAREAGAPLAAVMESARQLAAQIGGDEPPAPSITVPLPPCHRI